MLRRLLIENIGVIERLDIPFDDGFTVLTGETGAGKSIIVSCLSLALGERADGSVVRSGAARARLEAVFEPDEIKAAIPAALLENLGITDEESPLTLHVTREIHVKGRSECAVNGRKVSLKVLRQAGRYLAESHGQRQTLALLETGEQRNILDHYGDLDGEREAAADSLRQLRLVRADVNRLRRSEAEAADRRETLQHELAAFRDIAPTPGEDTALERERSRLAHAEQLGHLADSSRELLIESQRGDAAVTDTLAEIARNLRQAAALDSNLRPTWEAAEALAEQAQEIAVSMGRYSESLDADPTRLNLVEGRIGAIDDLKRRHGGTLEDVISWAEQTELELAGLERDSERAAELAVLETRLNAEVMERAQSLSAKRAHAAARFGRALETEIETLALAGTRVVVDVRSSLAAAGEDESSGDSQKSVDALRLCDESGSDEVEFLIAPNEGEPLRPLSQVASGGEMARVMLAVKTTLSCGDARTLALDEIDVGVGGHVGGAIGGNLAMLGRWQQVICVTHLPQVAAHADQHIRVFKQTEGGRAFTRIEHLREYDARAGELAKMIGSNTAAGLRSMGELLDSARRYDGAGELGSGIVLRLLEAVG